MENQKQEWGGVKTSIETITPELAEHYLKFNTRNRYNCKGNPETIKSFAEDMKMGLWKLNGSSISFSDKDILLDGQHRLYACIMAGVPFTTLVVRGLPDDCFDTIDIGLMRKGGQLLQMHGVANYNMAAAGITRYFTLCRTNLLGVGPNISSTRLAALGKTKAQLVDFYKEHQGLVDEICTNFTNRKGLVILSTSTMVGLSLYLILEKGHNKEKVFCFFSQLMTGENVENKTITLLRERLLKDKIGQDRMTGWAKNVILAKAWNCYILGKELNLLKASASETAPDYI